MTPVLRLVVVLCLSVAAPVLSAADSYVVLYVGHNGSGTHKAVSEKDQDAFKKSLDEEFQKSKKAYQDEKKAFNKDNPGKKFDKPEPQKSPMRVVKRGIKSLNEARKVAADMDKELREKAAKKNGHGDKGKDKEKDPE